MKYFFVVGEASGDLHASNLIKELKSLDSEAVLEAWGGDLMYAQGVRINKHIAELAFMGFKEVILNLRTILANFKLIKKQIKDFAPDVVVLVDYPGFNLRLAKWLKIQKIPCIYYIMPQAWAWKENRVEKLKEYIDLNICILPFEVPFFSKKGLAVEYVGHPIMETIKLHLQERKTIALLPGSREQEIKLMLPIMLSVRNEYPDISFSILKSPNIDVDFYAPYLSDQIGLSSFGAAELLNKSCAALVTSGTATLETALYEVPQIVCYKSGALSYKIAKRLIKVPFISLVNLLANKEIVKELIQDNLNKTELTKELNKILFDTDYKKKMAGAYQGIKKELGNDASQKAAQLIHAYLKTKR